MRTVFLALALLVASCATPQDSAYQVAAPLATPHTLAPGARWALILLDGSGQITATLVVKLTDVPIQTCDSGDYRRVKVISEYRPGGSVPLHEPSYEVVGAAVRIQLSSGMCDAGYAVIGGVRENGFEGVHMAEVLIAPQSERSQSGEACLWHAATGVMLNYAKRSVTGWCEASAIAMTLHAQRRRRNACGQI